MHFIFLRVKYNTKISKTQKKRASTQKYSNSSILKVFKTFLISSSCGFPLEAGYLGNLGFAITKP